MRPRLPSPSTFRWSLALVSVAACGADPLQPSGDLDLMLEEIASGLEFPLLVAAPPGDPTRLFVVEKRGVIRLVRNGSLVGTPVLDLRPNVSTGGEQGLLGFAFHPDYADNRIVIVSYTDAQGDTRISTVRMDPGGDVAVPGTEQVFVAVDQPFSNHNGGHVTFGPQGHLFIGLGDGGGSGDPQNNARNPQTMLGKLLRFEIDGLGVARIPPGNPFVGQPGFRWEIWNLGLRNPWRFSFDVATGDLYIADVGQSDLEEVNVSTGQTGFGRALDYGWSVMEGTRCFKPATDCDQTNLAMPVLVYDHSHGCSVTGGHVYRGQRIPELAGTYFYGDFCGGWIRSFRFAGGEAADQREWPALEVPQLTSFGQDAEGELYVTSGNGRVFRIARR